MKSDTFSKMEVLRSDRHRGTHGHWMDTSQKLLILFGIVANLLNKWYLILAAHHNLLGNFKKMYQWVPTPLIQNL